MKRSSPEDTVRQLKILIGSLNPMGVLLKLACWIVGLFVTLCLLIKH